ncbi:ABC transporter ATP-binding protein [Sphingosinicella rhizophila]|uniref:ABC transporter ATP-binding protein n=1 Tax=Sphingosinicella rhizophila TaxID=3050082 RepID=A0ABU3Q8B4_9SPHN|nr:ABC transporter ATP-binding protein [Sphingosinicella sp. GR2756]MDT9599648.1 ABC transporter ATP-binding protein [Sphingosinicella sp. GR2756]
MSARRRLHFHLTIALMLVGALAELMTIGAVLPFLALLADPGKASQLPAVRVVYDLFGWRAGEDLIGKATLLLIGIAIFAALVRLLLTWVSQSFIFRLGHDMGNQIYSRVLRQPYRYHVQRNSSEVLAAIEKVQTAIFGVLLQLMQAAVAAVMAIFIIAILVAIDPTTALAAAALLAILYIVVSIGTQRLLTGNSHIINLAHNQRMKQLQEGLGGIRDILIDRSQPVFERSFSQYDDQLRRAQMANMFVAAAPRFVVEAIGIVAIALLALYMSSDAGGLVAAIPILGALALGAQRLLPLLQLVYLGWSRAAGSLHTLSEIVQLSNIEVPPGAMAGPPATVRAFARDIVLDRVTFSYGGRQTALRNVSFAIARGERIGFIGKTGSGKSTLLDLVMGLLEPNSGEIRIDGVTLDAAERPNWQAQIAHVPQFIYLADSSIAANIAFGQPEGAIDMARVRTAAAQAQIADFIEELPEAYLTEVGERGIRLSGGQRQRIGIARALYKKAQILILDEATSALDDDTEEKVIEALAGAGAGPGRTVLMIAHRLSTLKACDRLIRLEAGEVKTIGTYDEVIGASASVRGAA